MSDKVEVNLTGVKQSKGVWLVKVPKYLSQQWDKATEKGEVGKITIGNGFPQVCFSLSEDLAALGSAEEKDASVQVPRDHPFTMQTVGGQTMAVFSQSDTGVSAADGSLDCESAPQTRSGIMSFGDAVVCSLYLPDRRSAPPPLAHRKVGWLTPVSHSPFAQKHAQKHGFSPLPACKRAHLTGLDLLSQP
ncbi:General transcription factor IIF subunit 2 [Oryzias melastigma]|uniref:General transcription factor IIF subunit 2 n=1 Tax=Oryzias melastigma TaxID=30732 RepID=A0A834L0H7_ORYME|nr:General transcription factor IIF subunit 2 [Oryzias melastigma]